MNIHAIRLSVLSVFTPVPFRSSVVAGLALAAPASAQSFTTPGMPSRDTGQVDISSTEFNPAIGAVIDADLSWLEAGDDDADDGLRLRLRSFELSTNAWIDPDTWAYAVLVGTEEDFELEEAAVHYQGLGGRSTLRAGRFYVDFGKQMQAHTHDLAYPDRPAVLRAYLGEELSGTGLQYDDWFALGDESALRWSVAIFDSLLPHEHDDEGHGHAGEEHGSEAVIAERKQADEVSWTARATAFHDVGDSGVFQWGFSARHQPDFRFVVEEEDEDLIAADLSNTVLGVDLTYGWGDETGERGWTIGGEYLSFRGDIGAEVVTQGTDEVLDVLDDERNGYYLWIDREWSPRDSTGLLYSAFEHVEEDAPWEREATLYWTRHLTEFSRLRLALTHVEREEGDDDQRLLVQFTNFIGAHGHGVNW